MALLEIEGLKTYYMSLKGPVRAVDDVSLSLDRGRVLGIAGESGCGKSTLAWSILGMVPPPGKIVAGSIYVDGIDIVKLSEDELRSKIRWKKVSMIFQGAMNSLNPVYTAGAQMEEVMIYHAKMSKLDARRRVYELLESVGLDRSIANRYPHELSGGQKQRVVIAMALALEPDIVIADEPTTALDVVVQAQILNLLKRLQREKGLTIILITHDLAVIAEMADEVAIMYAGKVVEYGPSDYIFYKPRHPYTHLLMRAVPKLKGAKESLIYIPGQPPDLINPPKGCRFAPRCPWRMEECSEDPGIFKDDGWTVSCWLPKRGVKAF